MYGQDINIAFTNNSETVQPLVLFKNADPASQQGKSYVFTLPYAATYVSYFRIKIDGVDHSFFNTEPTTREDVVIMLNSMGIESWSISSSTANNIFTGFSATKNIQEFEVIDLAVDESGYPILDENNEPILI
jgi:hypothetical protein